MATGAYVFKCRACGFEFDMVIPGQRRRGSKREFCDECRTVKKQEADAKSRANAMARMADPEYPVMTLPEVRERWPSTTWGEADWKAAFDRDEELAWSILDGIGRIVTTRLRLGLMGPRAG